MLLATQSQSVVGTQQYFEQVLTQGDYYLGQEVGGCWRGLGAELLGVGEGSRVTREQFIELLHGRHPLTGARLTQRVRKDRRPGMDLTFSAPKSVSLAWAATGDEAILEALREAVVETMQRDIEPLMQVRVRRGAFAHTKQKAPTGRLIYADFLHKTSRPVGGHPDPHLHIHAFVMNWTFHQGRHYAGEMEEIVRQRPSLQARFESRLATRLEQLGYRTEPVYYRQSGRVKRGWELAGVERETIEKFSRRTQQIEEEAERKGVTDAAEKGKLGKLTREKKNGQQTIDSLRETWRGRLTPAERHTLDNLKRQKARESAEGEAERATRSVTYALEHHLYRESTVERRQLAATALEHGLSIRPEAVEKAIDKLGLIERTVDAAGGQRRMVTTRSVLKAEREMIAYARDGRGTKKAIKRGEHTFSRGWLNEQQKDAVQHVLSSRDAVIAVVGGAGTGKTSLKQEAVEAVRNCGKEVFSVAPSSGATEVLREKGFKNAATVEHLLRNTKSHEQLKGQVLWVDEAGLLDVRSMRAVLRIADEQGARVILSGDARQHASPRRGEALRILEKEAGLKLARVEKIQRQREAYRRAVALISRGHEVVDPRSGKTGLVAGFDLLDSLGKVKELAGAARHDALAETYAGAIGKGRSALVVAPTHAEARAATDAIRTRLKQEGQLTGDEKTFPQYRSLNLTEAEKGEARTYRGLGEVVVEFHQNAKGGIGRGERFRVAGVADGRVRLVGVAGKQTRELPLGNTYRELPLEQASRFEVYAEGQVTLAAGDRVRFSLGGKTKDQSSRIANGRLDVVKGFTRSGDLVLANGWKVAKEYAHLDLGYVVTSHASQGKDRDVAIAAMGARSLPAVNAKQFYVTASRGKEDVVIYVDDKQKVRSAIQRSGERLSATELIRSAKGESSHAKSQDRTRRSALGAFRERAMQWWRSVREAGAGRLSIGRERGLDAGSSGGGRFDAGGLGGGGGFGSGLGGPSPSGGVA